MGQWDDTLKRMIKSKPQDFISWVLKEAQFQEALATELKGRTIVADLVFGALLRGQKTGVHFEVQKKKDDDMGRRLLEYNIFAVYEHKCYILSCVIYLRKQGQILDSPLVWRLPNGQVILEFHFVVIKLWEKTVEELLQAGLAGLLPLLPLAQDGHRYEVLDLMVQELSTIQEWGLLSLGKTIAGLVFTDEADQTELQRRFAMYEDILEDSWVYQEILEKGQKQGLELGQKQGLELGKKQGLELGKKQGKQEGQLEALQQMLISIIQTRFPEMVRQANKQVAQATNREQLQQAVIEVSIARDASEVARALSSLSSIEKP